MYICSMVVHIISINKSIKAYDFFNQYVEISELPMFAGTQTAEKDSTFMTVQFYAAAAALAKDSRLAIAALERAKNTPYRQYDVYQYLCYEYGRQELLRILLCWKNIRRRHAGFSRFGILLE